MDKCRQTVMNYFNQFVAKYNKTGFDPTVKVGV
jgi:hypothetical protein